MEQLATCDLWIVHAPQYEVTAETIRAAISEFDIQAAAFFAQENDQ